MYPRRASRFHNGVFCVEKGEEVITPPTLPPLPIVDGWLFIDNSMVESMTECLRQAEYSRIYRRRLARDRAALNFGSGIHKAMEARYTSPNYDYVDLEVTKAMQGALAQHLELHPQPEGEYRTYEYGCKLIENYNNQAQPVESFEILELEGKGRVVEHAFATPLVNGENKPIEFEYTGFQEGSLRRVHNINIMYTGRIDLAIREGSAYGTLDHKTAFQFGDSFWNEQRMSGQHVGYCWSLDQILGINTTFYIVNAFRTRPPSKTERGKGSFLPDDYGRRPYYITPERKQEWLHNLCSLIRQFLHAYSSGYMPMSTKWCTGKYGACQFFDVCSLPLEQRTAMLQSGLYEDDDWTPLEEAKKKGLPISQVVP